MRKRVRINFILKLCFFFYQAQSGPKHNKVVTCYVASWAIYRRGNGKFDIPDIEPELCTHLIYTFAGLDSTKWAIKSLDPYLDVTRGKYMLQITRHD